MTSSWQRKHSKRSAGAEDASISSILSDVLSKKKESQDAKLNLEEKRLNMQVTEMQHRHEMEKRRITLDEDRAKRDEKKEEAFAEERRAVFAMMQSMQAALLQKVNRDDAR